MCVGPRSAVFAPIADLGLIVVDEEHDGSYKHEGDPRYDARTVALERARTPRRGPARRQRHAAARERGRAMRRLRLPSRVDGQHLPPVQVLDMRGAHHPLHPRTRTALADVRRAQGKAIVLLNRRGWSNFLSCRACGHVWMCPNCEVALVLHRAGATVACHHCGHRERVPDALRGMRLGRPGPSRRGHRAPRARAARGARRGAGFPGLPPRRRRGRGQGRGGAHAGRLRRRAQRRARRAPRWWPRATTSPTSPSASCSTPTRRCASPTSAPRSGRSRWSPSWPAGPGAGRARGVVLVQTLAPEARSIQFAARHDSDGFLERELGMRRALGYPPFGTLIRVDLLLAAGGRRARAGHARCATRSRCRGTACSVRPRCFACAARPGPSW